MEDIFIIGDKFKFRFRWESEFLGKKGCDVCSLKDDEYCPKEKCTKDGCYVIMTQHEQLNERIQKWLDEKKLKKQQELDISGQSGLKK